MVYNKKNTYFLDRYLYKYLLKYYLKYRCFKSFIKYFVKNIYNFPNFPLSYQNNYYLVPLIVLTML